MRVVCAAAARYVGGGHRCNVGAKKATDAKDKKGGMSDYECVMPAA